MNGDSKAPTANNGNQILVGLLTVLIGIILTPLIEPKVQYLKAYYFDKPQLNLEITRISEYKELDIFIKPNALMYIVTPKGRKFFSFLMNAESNKSINHNMAYFSTYTEKCAKCYAVGIYINNVGISPAKNIEIKLTSSHKDSDLKNIFNYSDPKYTATKCLNNDKECEINISKVNGGDSEVLPIILTPTEKVDVSCRIDGGIGNCKLDWMDLKIIEIPDGGKIIIGDEAIESPNIDKKGCYQLDSEGNWYEIEC